eukprot:TRINITY_DN29842_c0_g2_i1.p2 TRINITY_DN29842_c0_g2~~TRINITY_DN29842_c0_g2_i1.p2  ORF type:complete len:111 (+),score=39.16 TRINITY_DN29842_c0_g2_i1:66-398(+)
MGLEIEFTNRGIELDNLSLSALLKLMTSTGLTGLAAGTYIGMQIGATFFTESSEKRRKSQDLSTFACYAMSTATFVCVSFLYISHGWGGRVGGGGGGGGGHGHGHGHHRH